MSSVEGRVAIVAGASTGIGRATAQMLAAEGAQPRHDQAHPAPCND
jgi:NAD(P)-dependent dehydrogenase (short-subunit alcohol dehydrogenase family)